MKMLYETAVVSKSNHLQVVGRQKNKQKSSTQKWLNCIANERKDHPSSGLRKIYETHNPEGIGRDGFMKWAKSQGKMLQPKKSFFKTTYPDKETRLKNEIEDKELNNVNQVWTSDITYLYNEGSVYYLVTIMDLYTRRIIGHNLSKTLKAAKSLDTLNSVIKFRLIDNYRGKLIHHSDKGSQYTSKKYMQKLKDFGIVQSVCEHVWDNAYHERVQGTLKNDYIYHWYAKSEKELAKNVTRAIANYNKRKHSSLLNNRSPIEFEAYINKASEEDRPKMEVFTVSKLNVTKNDLYLKSRTN
jgi:transposase InsO family protein